MSIGDLRASTSRPPMGTRQNPSTCGCKHNAFSRAWGGFALDILEPNKLPASHALLYLEGGRTGLNHGEEGSARVKNRRGMERLRNDWLRNGYFLVAGVYTTTAKVYYAPFPPNFS
jgi:hypothetical protein